MPTLTHRCLALAFALLMAGLTSCAGAATLRTGDGLQLSADLPARLGSLSIDGRPVSGSEGGFSLIDPRTGKAPAPGAFALTVRAKRESRRIVLSGVVTAAGQEETVCQLQARIPVGGDGWLFWDDMTRSRPIRAGQGYVQPVYPLCCVTDAGRQIGLAVGLDPDPLQPATLAYDPAAKAIVVTWSFGFTPLARPAYRMRAPFSLEIYRVQPGWAFRSALEGYYRFHPKKFDWRAKHEGLWLFASASDTLPNPQHYAYNEGGPPPTADLPRGIATFPYCCTGDLIVSLPGEWGLAKTYDEMLDRLARWEKLPRPDGWEMLSPYEIVDGVAHTGQRSLKLHATAAGQLHELRQVFELNQKKADAVTLSVWCKAQDVTGVKDADCGAWVDMEMADGEHRWGRSAPAEVGTHDWQELKLLLGGDKPISQIRLYLLLRGAHAGTAWFDDVSVTTASAPGKNLSRSPGFEASGPPAQAQILRDNVLFDEKDHMRYAVDTFGGADIPPASPLNWLRYTLLVNPDQKNPDGRPTASDVDFAKYDKIFAEFPQCRGAYMDGTSACCTTTFDYRRDHFACFNDPFQYRGSTYRPCASGMASVVRWVDAFKQRYRAGEKLAFGNVWASDRMFPVCMALDVVGYESSRWYDLAHADYYRAAAYHKPGLYLNYFRIGQQLDTREGGEKFFRYSTAYGLFPSIGRYTDEAYEKFGDLQHLYVPMVKHLFRAGWEPVTHAQADDPAVRVQRFGTKLPVYFTLLNPGAAPREVRLTIDAGALGLKGTEIAAVEMVGGAWLPMGKNGASLSTLPEVRHVSGAPRAPTAAGIGAPRKRGLLLAKCLEARLALGPEDVAVVALLPARGVGAWYRQRAAESLEGAAFVYAQTTPTASAAELGKRIRALDEKAGARRIAGAVGAVKADLAGLRAETAKLPESLKRRSCLREMDVALRLLDESLLADAGGHAGWAEGRIAPLDGQVTVSCQVAAGSSQARVAGVRAWPGRWVETPADVEGLPVGGALTLAACPQQRALTAVAEIAFTDAAGAPVVLRRRAEAFFGPVCELRGEVVPGSPAVSLHLRNSDRVRRRLTLDVSAPAGLSVQPPSVEVDLDAGESKDVTARLILPAGLASGTYPVKAVAKTPAGAVAEQVEVPFVCVLPLAAGDLALASAGARVVVDSSYYAYSEKPLNDGIVLPAGQAFNECAWASGEADGEHWVEIRWPQRQKVGKVVVYWNVENGTVWTSRRIVVQAKRDGAWQELGAFEQPAAQPVSELRFPPATTDALRILQPAGGGPVSRPNMMWLREVAAYAE